MLWIVLGAVVLFVVLFLITPLCFRVEYGYCFNAKQQRLSVYVAGVKVFTSDFKKQNKEVKPEQTQDKPDFNAFMHNIKLYQSLMEKIKADIEAMLVYLKNKLVIRRYTVHFDLGFEDASHTGLASGAAYALVYGISALIYNNLNLVKKNMDICVMPQFHKPCIDFYFDGIFRLRVVHIIKAAIYIFKLYMKSKNILNTKEGGAVV